MKAQRGIAVIAILMATMAAACAAHTTPVTQSPLPSSTNVVDQPSPANPVESGAPAIDVIAAGDIGVCDSTNDDATGALAASLPGVVATLGDTAYPDGTTQQLEECFGGSWGVVKDRIKFAVTGNHDVHTDGGAPFYAYMGSAAVRDGHTWFSEDLGAWHVVVLDGNCGLIWPLFSSCSSGSEQARWLHEDLAASGARCTLALLHQPRFSSGQHGDALAVGALWNELYAAGAELVLDGHDHDYERFAPQTPDGAPDEARGVVEIVVGTGGTDLEAFKDAQPNSLVRINDAYGVLDLTLAADSWSSRFVDIAGVTQDSSGGTCH